MHSGMLGTKMGVNRHIPAVLRSDYALSEHPTGKERLLNLHALH